MLPMMRFLSVALELDLSISLGKWFPASRYWSACHGSIRHAVRRMPKYFSKMRTKDG
jgi:hypothetical protein